MKLKVDGIDPTSVIGENVFEAAVKLEQMRETEYSSLDELINDLPKNVCTISTIMRGKIKGEREFLSLGIKPLYENKEIEAELYHRFFGSYAADIEIDDNMQIKSFPLIYALDKGLCSIGKVRIIRE